MSEWLNKSSATLLIALVLIVFSLAWLAGFSATMATVFLLAVIAMVLMAGWKAVPIERCPKNFKGGEEEQE